MPDALTSLLSATASSRSRADLHVLIELAESDSLSRAAVASEVDSDAAQLLYLDCLATALKDHELTREELTALRHLRTALGITEGQLFRERQVEVEEVVRDVMYTILADLELSRDEARLKVGLQEALALGYDEFTAMGNQPLHEALQLILYDIDPLGQGLTEEQFEVFARQAMRIESTFPIESEEAEPHRRHIPQHVKDAVWRRDQGRCARCSADANLEFDHIIPFSKGGASTYRNVQLLCQRCNRSKAAQLG